MQFADRAGIERLAASYRTDDSSYQMRLRNGMTVREHDLSAIANDFLNLNDLHDRLTHAGPELDLEELRRVLAPCAAHYGEPLEELCVAFRDVMGLAYLDADRRADIERGWRELSMPPVTLRARARTPRA